MNALRATARPAGGGSCPSSASASSGVLLGQGFVEQLFVGRLVD
jgi:hypothetical protein